MRQCLTVHALLALSRFQWRRDAIGCVQRFTHPISAIMLSNERTSSLETPALAPAVVCVAPNGARRNKQDHTRIPLTALELAHEAQACVAAGATVIHLHVRDAFGKHSLEANHYRAALDAIRDAVGERLVLQVTTEAAGVYQPAQQMAVVRELRPECASVALRELAPDQAAYDAAGKFFNWAFAGNIGLQYILYSPAEAMQLIELQRQGVVPHVRPHALFVLGRYTAGQRSRSQDLLPFLAEWPEEWPWSVCAFGPTEAQCIAAAIALGGHARVGFENNLFSPAGALAASNASNVANVRSLIEHTGRPLASVHEARALYAGKN